VNVERLPFGEAVAERRDHEGSVIANRRLDGFDQEINPPFIGRSGRNGQGGKRGKLRGHDRVRMHQRNASRLDADRQQSVGNGRRRNGAPSHAFVPGSRQRFFKFLQSLLSLSQPLPIVLLMLISGC